MMPLPGRYGPPPVPPPVPAPMPGPVPSPSPVPLPVPAPPPLPGPWLSRPAALVVRRPARSRASAATRSRPARRPAAPVGLRDRRRRLDRLRHGLDFGRRQRSAAAAPDRPPDRAFDRHRALQRARCPRARAGRGGAGCRSPPPPPPPPGPGRDEEHEPGRCRPASDCAAGSSRPSVVRSATAEHAARAAAPTPSAAAPRRRGSCRSGREERLPVAGVRRVSPASSSTARTASPASTNRPSTRRDQPDASSASRVRRGRRLPRARSRARVKTSGEVG